MGRYLLSLCLIVVCLGIAISVANAEEHPTGVGPCNLGAGGFFDGGDLGVLAGEFGSVVDPGDPNSLLCTDFDNDFDVDGGDLGVFAGNFGVSGSAPAIAVEGQVITVPEPAGWALVASVLATGLARRRGV